MGSPVSDHGGRWATILAVKNLAKIMNKLLKAKCELALRVQNPWEPQTQGKFVSTCSLFFMNEGQMKQILIENNKQDARF